MALMISRALVSYSCKTILHDNSFSICMQFNFTIDSYTHPVRILSWLSAALMRTLARALYFTVGGAASNYSTSITTW